MYVGFDDGAVFVGTVVVGGDAACAVVDALTHGGVAQVGQVVGFGTFEVRERPERQGRNPQTKEPMTIAASKLPAFKAGKALKDAVQ